MITMVGMQRMNDRSNAVGLAVGADNAAAIDGEHHRQVLDRHVMDQLIVGALQEGGIDRHHRLVAADRQPGGEGDRVLLGDRHVEILLRVVAGELHHAGAFAHCRRDCHQRAVFGGGFTQPVAEDFRIGRQAAGAFRQRTAGRIELRHRVEADRILLRRRVTAAFWS